MAVYNLGRILPVFKGTYSSTTQYHKMDVVLYSGSSYVAKQDVMGLSPSTASSRKPYWQQIALKGQLSGELDASTQQAIINAILSNGNIVVDGDYVHTDNNFTDNYKNKIDNLEINDGVLTVKKNGTTVGTFTANQQGDQTIDITVPTNNTELVNGMGYISEKNLIDYTGASSVTILLDEYHNNFYECGTINTISLSYNYDVNNYQFWCYPSSIIHFVADTSINFLYSGKVIFGNCTEFESGEEYLIEVKGGVAIINNIKTI